MTWAAFFTAAVQIVFLVNLFWSMRRGTKAPPNPWSGRHTRMGEGKDWSFAVSAAGHITQGNTERPGRSALRDWPHWWRPPTMLLAALTSAYIVRRGLAGDWTPVPLPLVLPGSVLLLMLSSLALEIGPPAFQERQRAFASMWFGGVALGVDICSDTGLRLEADQRKRHICRRQPGGGLSLCADGSF